MKRSGRGPVLLVLVAMLHVAPMLSATRVDAQTPAFDDAAALILLRSTLIALNHANLTGNYTVLQDLSAPSFAADYSAATLGIAFLDLRERNLNIAPVSVLVPIMTEVPGIVDGGLLRIVGHFPSRPTQINFDLYFQPINGRWRLAGMSVDAVDIPPDDAAAGESE